MISYIHTHIARDHTQGEEEKKKKKMNGFDHPQRQDQYTLKRMRWQEIKREQQHINIVSTGGATPPFSGGLSFTGSNPNSTTNLQGFPAGLLDSRHDDLVSTVVPAVTVVLEGRSICQRISLHKHASYQSLAKALRQMFAEEGGGGGGEDNSDLDLSNAVPGHLIAYEDMENDLLLAGDLNWKDFVRVAKRIRILPAKSNGRKGRERV